MDTYNDTHGYLSEFKSNIEKVFYKSDVFRVDCYNSKFNRNIHKRANMINNQSAAIKLG